MGVLEELIDEEHPGYRCIEAKEKAVAQRLIPEHLDLVRLWLKLLDQFSVGGAGVHAVEDPDENQRITQVVRFTFFDHAIGHSKAALDSTVTGRYHHACFSLRYMSELLIHAMYVRFRPAEARRWYKDLAQPSTADHPPTFEKAFKVVKQEMKGHVLVPPIYDINKDMDARGAHPSQIAVLQTLEQAGDHARIGPRYDRNHTIATLDAGLFLTLVLLEELDPVVVEHKWRAQMDPLWDERLQLMAPYWSQNASSGASPQT